MQALSRVIGELYDLAELAPMPHFPGKALDALRKLVAFDGAMFGGRVEGANWRKGDRQSPGLRYEDVRIQEGSRIPDCATFRSHNVLREDGVVACTGCSKGRPMAGAGGIEPSGQGKCPSRLLLCESLPSDGKQGVWLLLCRASGRKFANDEKKYLQAVWPHFMRGLAINCQRVLESQRRQMEDCAIALVNGAGNIGVADSGFHDCLAAEWPDYAGEQLPPAVMDCWSRERPYVGARIEIRFRQQAGSLVCIARPYSVLTGLTKTERIVAQYFASGLSHKEVAQTLGVSQNTVRTHLKQAYSKLGIHDKAQLANRFASTPLRMPGMK